MQLSGLHHLTAIAGDPQRNLDFYTRLLGLRLVKKTVNFDDPTTYHLYYGDPEGSPGSLLTFFPWTGIRRGRPGVGQACALAFNVPAGALDFWRHRLTVGGVILQPAGRRFGEEVLPFTDPDGLPLELIASAEAAPRNAWAKPDIAGDLALRGLHSFTIALRDEGPTGEFLREKMGCRAGQTEGNRKRLAVGSGSFIDLLAEASLPEGLSGSGTVHHAAFRTPDEATQLAAAEELRHHGCAVSPVMDRDYFRSIYFREPGGVLFEIATDGPGFATDEQPGELGTALKLPARYRAQRSVIEATLPALD